MRVSSFFIVRNIPEEIFNGNRRPLGAGREPVHVTPRENNETGRLYFIRGHSVITAVSMKRPSALFATTALVRLAGSLARTGQRPYLSRLSCTPAVVFSPVSLALLSLSLADLSARTAGLSLIRCTGRLSHVVGAHV